MFDPKNLYFHGMLRVKFIDSSVLASSDFIQIDGLQNPNLGQSIKSKPIAATVCTLCSWRLSRAFAATTALRRVHSCAVKYEPHISSFMKIAKFNRRTSKSRGLLFYRLLQQAVMTKPVTYQKVVEKREKSEN